jgi:hypothetical protein
MCGRTEDDIEMGILVSHGKTDMICVECMEELENDYP